jgi:L-2-hydroxyglutarate oxidase LhgO
LLVATTDVELERMQSLYQRALGHDVTVELLDSAQLRRRESNVVGLGAIWVPFGCLRRRSLTIAKWQRQCCRAFVNWAVKWRSTPP